MKKKTRFIFYASLLFNLMAIVYLTPKIFNKLSPSETIDTSDNYWMQRNKYLNTLPVDTNSIVLIGTSLTHNFEIQETVGDNIKNRGINGDNLQGIIGRLEHITKGHPKKIIIEAGINDIGDLHHSTEDILTDFEALVSKIINSSPESELFVTSIFPVADSSDRMSSYCSPEINTQIEEINHQLASLTKKKGVIFLNFHQEFSSNNKLDSKFSMDGVHFSAEGYNLWQKLILPYLD